MIRSPRITDHNGRPQPAAIELGDYAVLVTPCRLHLGEDAAQCDCEEFAYLTQLSLVEGVPTLHLIDAGTRNGMRVECQARNEANEEYRRSHAKRAALVT